MLEDFLDYEKVLECLPVEEGCVLAALKYKLQMYGKYEYSYIYHIV